MELRYFDVANSDDMRLKLLDHFASLSMTHGDLASVAVTEGRIADAAHHEQMAVMHRERAEGFH
jgi:hypothetical protein